MNNNLKKVFLILMIFSLSVFSGVPFMATAQPAGYFEVQVDPSDGQYTNNYSYSSYCPKPPQNFKDFTCILIKLVRMTIPYVATSAILAFIWGLSKFIFNAGNEEKISEGKMLIKWGVIGLLFMFSIWGVVLMITKGFGFTFGIPLLPQ